MDGSELVCVCVCAASVCDLYAEITMLLIYTLSATVTLVCYRNE